MNDRIKSIAIECAGALDWDPPKDPTEYTYTPIELKKFADLIVNECCQMMLDMETKYPANLTVREIKKHFGV